MLAHFTSCHYYCIACFHMQTTYKFLKNLRSSISALLGAALQDSFSSDVSVGAITLCRRQMLHASYGLSLRALGCVQMQENLYL